MSKTHCRFCDMTVLGIYVNCPRCGNYLPPLNPGETVPAPTPAEPFELYELGDSWAHMKKTDPEPRDEDIEKPEYDLCHFVERKKRDINVLHVYGCDVSPENKDARCPLMDFLRSASDAELKILLPKTGDYEMFLKDGHYTTKPFSREKKKSDTLKP